MEKFEMQQEWENQPIPMDGRRAQEKRLARSSTVKRERRKLSMGACGCCGLRERLEIHHIHPLCFGGPDEINNTIALCSTCHKYAPDEPERFYAYQRQGGQMISHLSASAIDVYRKLSGETLGFLGPVYERMMREISVAIASCDSEKIHEITKHRLCHQDWGIVPLADLVGIAMADPSKLLECRRKNMSALAEQRKVIKYMIASFHPYIPEPPAALGDELWDDREAVEEWHSRWEEFMHVVHHHRLEGRISQDFYANCRNGWLGSESMIDFLDGLEGGEENESNGEMVFDQMCLSF